MAAGERRYLTMPGDRRLGYLELGDPAGPPALYLHGTPSSAGEARWLHAAARVHGVRLVSADRPGYLRSDRRPIPSLLGTGEDVLALADALDLARFALIGFSGGAGYALATAALAPGRVTVVHIGGGIGSLAGAAARDLPPARRAMFRLAAAAPAVVGPVLAGGLGLLRRGIEKRLGSPAEAAAWFFEGPAKGDQRAAVDRYVRTTPPEELREELADYAEGTRATRAILDDMRAYVQPWPFDLSGLDVPVELWHGSDDPAAPPAFAERTAATLPNAQLHVFPGEGHFVFHSHADDVAVSVREHAA